MVPGYRLVRLDYGSGTALRSVNYYLLMPTAFVLSGALTEALFAALAMASRYCARRGRWRAAGTAGLLAAFTRPTGLLLLAPLAWIYFSMRDQRRRDVGWDAPRLTLPLPGPISFGLFSYYSIGDILAYPHTQGAGWGHHASDPFGTMLAGLVSSRMPERICAAFAAVAIVLVTIYADKLRGEHLILAVCFLLSSLAAGTVMGMPRYPSVVFPLAIILARLPIRRSTGWAIAAALALVQGAPMVFWTNGFLFMR